jgi:hypothetical protein
MRTTSKRPRAHGAFCARDFPIHNIKQRRSRFRSRDAMASEALGTKGKFRLQISEGRRSADRRIFKMSAPRSQTLPSESASGAVARHTRRCCHLKVLRARSPLGAPLTALAAQINATAQPRPRFARNRMRRHYLRLESRLQRCTSRAGHSAGRFDAQAAGGGVTNPARRNRTRSVSRPSPVTSLR